MKIKILTTTKASATTGWLCYTTPGDLIPTVIHINGTEPQGELFTYKHRVSGAPAGSSPAEREPCLFL